MNQATKQRIVGSIVLLLLGLIFLPMIFDGESSYQSPVSSRIPEPPVIPELSEPQPSRPEILSDTDTISLIEADDPDALEDPAGQTTEPAPEDVTDAETEETEEPVVAEAEAEETADPEPAFTREVPELDSETGLPQGWSVRLGSFADARNAINLTQRLQDAGYKAYSREVENEQGTLTVIYVGPWLDRALADQRLERLQDEFQLAGMVVPYEMRQL